MIIMYYGNISTAMQTMWAYMAAATGGNTKTMPEMPYYYRGKYRIGKILSHAGSGMITQKEAQRNFGDRYKYIKVDRYGVYGVPK